MTLQLEIDAPSHVARPYEIRKADLDGAGWILIDRRAKPGLRVHYPESEREAIALMHELELPRLAGDEWEVAKHPGQLTVVWLHRKNSTESRRFRNATDACGFLIAHRADVERRAALREQRDLSDRLASLSASLNEVVETLAAPPITYPPLSPYGALA